MVVTAAVAVVLVLVLVVRVVQVRLKELGRLFSVLRLLL